MNRGEFINILKNSQPLLSQVASSALAILSASPDAEIDECPAPLDKEHWISIYSRRVAFAEYRENEVIGLRESVEAFRRGQGSYRSLSVVAGSRLIYFWIDDNVQLVGCIIGNDNKII